MKATERRFDIRYTSPYLIVIGAATGARFAELLGLTWDDVDLKNHTISINKTWLLNKGFGPTKNKSSIRMIDIDEHTTQVLKKLHSDQENYLIEMNVKNPNNLVFYNTSSGSITSSAVNKTLKKIQEKLNIEPKITFHGLRHTHASVLLFKDIDILYVSERLGHKDVSITQTVYAHILEEMKQKNKPKIAKVLSTIYE